MFNGARVFPIEIKKKTSIITGYGSIPAVFGTKYGRPNRRESTKAARHRDHVGRRRETRESDGSSDRSRTEHARLGPSRFVQVFRNERPYRRNTETASIIAAAGRRSKYRFRPFVA